MNKDNHHSEKIYNTGSKNFFCGRITKIILKLRDFSTDKIIISEFLVVAQESFFEISLVYDNTTQRPNMALNNKLRLIT